MTDWRSRLAFEMPFLEQVLMQRGASSVLDCACGTGWHAIALAQRSYRAAGSDISAAMIARARVNAAREGVTIPFSSAGFQELRTAFRDRFDAVLCLGNSLPHVLTDEAALDSLVNMHRCLSDRGLLVLQNLNYNKRWLEKPRWFAVDSGTLSGRARPPMDDAESTNEGEHAQRETLVWRFADYGVDLITFNIALFTRSTNQMWTVEVQSTPQRPYQKSEIANLLLRAGFRDLTFYGSLKGEAFDVSQSGDLVVVAKG
jgi:ubiquinone/menaquinone biosynthesis C-methylase UbiE